MNQRPPKLRLHKSGNYFVRWGGKDHYLGREKNAAQDAYLAHIQQWSQWRA